MSERRIVVPKNSSLEGWWIGKDTGRVEILKGGFPCSKSRKVRVISIVFCPNGERKESSEICLPDENFENLVERFPSIEEAKSYVIGKMSQMFQELLQSWAVS